MNTFYKPGAAVIYRKHKVSSRPGRTATNLRPAANGDSYDYAIDKYWRVEAVHCGRSTGHRGRERDVMLDEHRNEPIGFRTAGDRVLERVVTAAGAALIGFFIGVELSVYEKSVLQIVNPGLNRFLVGY